MSVARPAAARREGSCALPLRSQSVTFAPTFHSFFSAHLPLVFTIKQGSLAFLANSLLFFKGKNVRLWTKK